MRKYYSIDLQQRCYIYPNGGCSRTVVNVLKDCLCGVEFVMLDDRSQETSLERFKDDIISNDYYLLLCAGDIQEELYEKCVSFGIKNIIDGREYTAFLLAQKIQNEAKLKSKKFEFLDNGKVLHIFDNKWITHLYYFYDIFAYYLEGSVIATLKYSAQMYCDSMYAELGGFLTLKEGVFVTYSDVFLSIVKNLKSSNITLYFGSLEYYLKNKNVICLEYSVVICPWILIDYFVNRNIFLTGGSLVLNFCSKNVKKIGYGHSLCEAFQFFPKRQKHKYLCQYIKRYFEGFDYYLAIDKPSKEAFLKVFSACGLDINILEAGSLSLDKKGVIVSLECEYFMFIPRLNSAECAEVIRILLKKNKKVIFRPHPAYLNYSSQYSIVNPYSYLEQFASHQNFSIDCSAVINRDVLAKSIVITDNSSTGYSTPLSTLRPTILFCPPKNEFDLRVENFGKSFVNPILHRVAISAEECVKVALQLEQDLASGGGGAKLREDIKKFRDENLYNQWHSAEAIAGLLEDIASGKI